MAVVSFHVLISAEKCLPKLQPCSSCTKKKKKKNYEGREDVKNNEHCGSLDSAFIDGDNLYIHF